jgi:hypothetical protein
MNTIVLTAGVILVMGVLGYLLALKARLGKYPTKPPAEYEFELDSQRKSIEFQRKEIARLERLNSDQDVQIRALLASGASLADVEQYARTKKEYDLMKADTDKIAMFLREHTEKQISEGRHSGMTLAEVCIMYMKRGLSQREAVQ